MVQRLGHGSHSSLRWAPNRESGSGIEATPPPRFCLPPLSFLKRVFGFFKGPDCDVFAHITVCRQKEEAPAVRTDRGFQEWWFGSLTEAVGDSARPNLLRKQLAIRALIPLLRAPIVEGAVDALLRLVHCLFHPGCKGIQCRLRHEGYVGTRAVDANTPARAHTRWHDVVSAILAGFGCCHLGAH